MPDMQRRAKRGAGVARRRLRENALDIGPKFRARETSSAFQAMPPPRQTFSRFARQAHDVILRGLLHAGGDIGAFARLQFLAGVDAGRSKKFTPKPRALRPNRNTTDRNCAL